MVIILGMKWVVLSFVIGLLLLAGCSASKEPSALSRWMENNGKVKVLSTTAIVDDLVAKIGGSYVDHLSLITGQMDPHSYELVKGDDEKILFAQLIFSHGLGLEHGASLHYQLHHHPHTVFLGDEIRKKVPERILFVDGQLDPHIWMDISLWMEGAEIVAQALAEKDPAHAAYYLEKGKEAAATMSGAHAQLKEKMARVPLEKRYLVTSHDAFHYFAKAYLCDEEKRCEAPEGLAPDGQLSTADIQRIIDHLLTHRIFVVFPESNVNKDALKKIVSSCANKGHPVRISEETLYGDSMGEAGSYLEMISHNICVLIKEWDE
jgi:manganese/zinc/iron transport system substrate-binding protein